MSKEELDPEVVADLRLRAYSEKDRSRTRGEPALDWKPSPDAAQWKCSTPSCKTFVGVDAEAIERWEIFNRELVKRGEKPIASHEVMVCDTCKAEHARNRPVLLRKATERMADVIKQLKAGEKLIRWQSRSGQVTADEVEAFAALKRWGHPDVEGFRQLLADKKASTPSKRERRGQF